MAEADVRRACASTGLSATAYVVLGLVSIRPMAGYDLVAYAERSIGNFFPLTRSHIYAELEHLGQLGLLEATETVQRDAPTKRVYQITRAGSNELQRWLDDTALTEERSRNLFLVRIFFGDRTSRERLAALLDEYEAAARTRIDLLAALVDRLAGGGVSIPPVDGDVRPSPRAGEGGLGYRCAPDTASGHGSGRRNADGLRGRLTC